MTQYHCQQEIFLYSSKIDTKNYHGRSTYSGLCLKWSTANCSSGCLPSCCGVDWSRSLLSSLISLSLSLSRSLGIGEEAWALLSLSMCSDSSLDSRISRISRESRDSRDSLDSLDSLVSLVSRSDTRSLATPFVVGFGCTWNNWMDKSATVFYSICLKYKNI